MNDREYVDDVEDEYVENTFYVMLENTSKMKKPILIHHPLQLMSNTLNLSPYKYSLFKPVRPYLFILSNK